MRKLAIFVICILAGISLKSQTNDSIQQGQISFITSQNIYVRFTSTENISPGDTLFIRRDGKNIPALIVSNLSSLSCVCVAVSDLPLTVNDEVFSVSKSKKATPVPEIAVSTLPLPEVKSKAADSTLVEKAKTEKPTEQEISGRLSISSYSNLSNRADFSQRMRYTLSLNMENIGGSKFSEESYISFVHRNGQWDEIKQSVFNGLKIYNLAVRYDINPTAKIWLGRKINPKISNIGAVDGVQAEKSFKAFSVGAVVGSRPDYEDYSINTKLFQFGGYLNHDFSRNKGYMQSSLAFIQQNNSGNIDRRFAYLQHSNSMINNLYFFGSMEVNLYKKVNEQVDNKPTVSNVYLMLRYRFSRKLSLSGSYSARDNVIYYETYKNIVEQLLEQETLHGYRAQLNYRPIKYLSFGVNAGYRSRKQDPKPSKNLYAYATYSRVPLIDASVTVSATLLETSYLSGNIFSINFSKDLMQGKLFGSIGYRYVDYTYLSSDYQLAQNMAEFNITWKMMKKLFTSLNYEGTFEKDSNYNRIYLNLTQRF